VWKGPFLDMWGVPTYIMNLIIMHGRWNILKCIQFIFSINKFNVRDLWFSQQH